MFCVLNDVKKYVHFRFLDKLDEFRPGAVEIHIDQINAEVAEALSNGGFVIPETNTSATLRRIAGVIAAWYCICELTTLMDTEAKSDNDWLPLQKNYDRAIKDLESIRQGLLNPFPEEVEDGTEPGGGVSVVVPTQLFDATFWESF